MVSRDRVAGRVAELRAAGRTVAMANGLFDLLHVGHLRYLEGAAAEADLLLVAVNSDGSARRLKGPSRPITTEAERAELLAGFACVDLVTVFDEDSVEPLLREVRPDVHCKGTDYTPDTVPEAPVARELGIRVAIVGDPKDHATSEIVKRLEGGERAR
ncbi:MAG: adenylyltransferase/cytidyltransferase family protein [Candidatus Eiseniibacteriota bacterium]